MRVDRRGFLVTAGAAAGAFALARPATGSATGLRALADDARAARLSRLPSARAATRTFGAAEWSRAQVGAGGEVLVPLTTGDGVPTLLVISEPGGGTLAAAAARSGDRTLFTDDLVVQLRDERGASLRWSTVDGRELASWQVEGEQRLAVGPAATTLARGLAGSSLSLAADLRPRGDARGDTLLFEAGSRGKDAIRSAAA